MANLKEIRTRIASVASTKKITSAMKMVSAAKFKKAQINVLRFRPFNDQVNNILQSSIEFIGSLSGDYVNERQQVKNIVLIVITSNNSMCGAFNSNIIKYSIEQYKSISARHPSARVTFYTLGKKGHEALSRRGYNVIELNHKMLDKPNIENTKDIFNTLVNEFKHGSADKIFLIYNMFKSAASQQQVAEQLLPINILRTAKKTNKIKPIIEPNPQVLVERILPYFLLNKIHSAILESVAAEHGARMTAMHQATENAVALHNQLLLEYNKARQAAITKEILEIVSGANALSSK
ncbi:MAG: ATP synthase F1 subunit gamma [Tenuifilum sp.]|uniref:ATP synthase F1 subunit gamma n=1 Tax=Tenuifilum sp. TaxID=2760880 RepID=UPI001B4D1990|nr:ATP synthase F1 subunit gamma [Bacteroidales bacterium]HOK61521.1 ATP synthase F1 subunit gamma [Tenuifilum sp.]MBP9028189.1 ATP synthase F1 subunit gamma [Bacteroidales bacterium]HOK85991.1 ATP synthase F1 subunit gamma [Tenuifilum sp.]HON70970.1 ATP synthase F1 subunit gamma [Tenuifilum sp.]